MTKLTVFLFLALPLTTIIYGQQNKFDIGFEGSPSIRFLWGNEIIDKYHKPTVGYSGGLSFQYNFPKIISIRTGSGYEKKGSVINIMFTDAYGNSTTSAKIYSNLHYLIFPFLLRATFGDKAKFFFNTGFFFGYLLSHREIVKNINYPEIIYNSTPRDKRFDSGLIGGMGFSIPIKDKFLISFELRNNLGLYNISAYPVINNGTIKTNSTNLLLNFTYKLGTRQTETK